MHFISMDLLIRLNTHTFCHTCSASKTCLRGLIFTILRHIKYSITSAVTVNLPYSGTLPFSLLVLCTVIQYYYSLEMTILKRDVI